jgi:lipase ATG15
MHINFLLKGIITINETLNIQNLYNLNDNIIINNVNDWFEMSYSNIMNLAKLSYNTYSYPDNSDWNNNTYFNNTNDISIDNATVRAYLFSNEDNTKHIIGIKGTKTMLGLNQIYNVYNDKFNDNLYYSCCFYKESSLYNKIKELRDEKCWDDNDDDDDDSGQYILSKSKKCKKKCFEIMNDYPINYVSIAHDIIEFIKSSEIYNINFGKHEILFTGHSLGGSLATLMALIYDKIGISFQSPGIKNFVTQSQILKKYNIKNKSFDKIYNFGHNADIIFKGNCKGRLSLCYIGGYIVETKCHIGKVCEYDAINKLNISESIFTHKLKYVIDNIIPNWETDFPECKKIKNCKDCESWKFV